jgi:hypothetical protein
LQLDEDGKKIKEEDPADQEGVLIVEDQVSEAEGTPAKASDDAPPAMKLSKAEAAALKVASMAKDDEPTLMDVKPAKRQAAKAGPKRGKAEPAKAEPAGSSKSARGAGAVKSAAAQPAEKPKLRLVNGKLVPVNEPKLF